MFIFYLQLKNKEIKSTKTITKLTEIFNLYYDNLEKNIDLKEIVKTIQPYLLENTLNKEVIDSICDEYNISLFNLINLINSSITNISLNEKLRNYYNRLSYKLTDIFIKNSYISNRDIEQAKILLSIQIENDIYSNAEFCNIIKCPYNLYTEYINVLKNINHPIYQEYLEYKKENLKRKYTEPKEIVLQKKKYLEEIKTLSKKELIDYINKGTTLKMKVFCELYDIPYVTCTYLKKADNSFIETLIENLKNSENVIKEYKNKYITIIKEVSSKIVEEKNNYSIYQHYETYNIDMYVLKQLAINLRLIDEYDVIANYILENPSSHYILTESEIDTMSTLGYLSKNNEIIKFDSNTLNISIEEIKEKKIPLIKGVIQEAIKRKQTKQKKLTQN